MDDMQTFERRVATEVVRGMGPSEPVDDAAIFTAITATQSRKWRFQSMFSATKFVVAGVIVALFAGFALAGVLTRPGVEQAPAPAAVSPQTLVRPCPTSQATQATVTCVTTSARPVEVTGVWGPSGLACPRDAAQGVSADLVQVRGYSCPGQTWQMSDPRLSGTVTSELNEDRYEGDLRFWIHVQNRTVSNDEGSWRSLPVVTFDDTDVTSATTQLALVGEGAYEGLVAVLDISGDGPMRGYIVEGTLPPAPEAEVTP